MAFTFTEAFLRVLFCLVHDCRMFARAFYIMEDPSSVLQLLSLNLQVADSEHAHSIVVYFLCSHVLHGSLSASLVETAVSTPQLCFTVHADILCPFC